MEGKKAFPWINLDRPDTMVHFTKLFRPKMYLTTIMNQLYVLVHSTVCQLQLKGYIIFSDIHVFWLARVFFGEKFYRHFFPDLCATRNAVSIIVPTMFEIYIRVYTLHQVTILNFAIRDF